METIEDLIAAAIEREPEFVTDNPYASMSHPNARRLALVKAWEMLTVECRQVVSHVGVPALFCDKGVWSPVEGESHNPYVGTAHEGCHGTGRVPATPPSTFAEAWQEARLRKTCELLFGTYDASRPPVVLDYDRAVRAMLTNFAGEAATPNEALALALIAATEANDD